MGECLSCPNKNIKHTLCFKSVIVRGGKEIPINDDTFKSAPQEPQTDQAPYADHDKR